MAMNNLSIDGEFRYIIQWFNEWSELQRDDFVPVLVEYLLQGSTSGVYVNGVVNCVSNVGIQDKPMSLFQCRIKLFREWNKKWPLEFKHKLKEKIVEIDAKIGEKILEEIKSHIDENINDEVGTNVNTENGNADVSGTEVYADELIAAAVAIVDATEEAINMDSRIVATLNRETSVDDNSAPVINTEQSIGATDSTVTIADTQQNNVEPAEQVQMQAHILEENVIDNDTVTATVA